MIHKRAIVKDLAKLIATELAQHASEITCLQIDREWALVPELCLSSKTKEKLAEFHNFLNRVVPDDFDYSIDFEGGGISGQLEFKNGIMSAVGGGFPVRFDSYFTENLRKIDWDELRQEMMSLTEFMDGAVSGPVPDWFKEHIASQRKHR